MCMFVYLSLLCDSDSLFCKLAILAVEVWLGESAVTHQNLCYTIQLITVIFYYYTSPKQAPKSSLCHDTDACTV